LFFQGTDCIFGYRQFQTPIINLAFKTADRNKAIELSFSVFRIAEQEKCAEFCKIEK